MFQVLTPTLDQNPIFGNVNPGESSMFLKWEYEFYKFIEWFIGILPVIFSQGTWDIIKAALSLVSIFCISVIVYCSVRMFEIRKKEHHHLEHEIKEYAQHQAEREKEKEKADKLSANPEWLSVLSHLSSADPSRWKLSIMEADSMLDKLLSQLGYEGESIGEKLKETDPKHFRHLPAAWEAHAVRNRIAHEGASFELSSREAKRIISLYQEIFQEFGFI